MKISLQSSEQTQLAILSNLHALYAVIWGGVLGEQPIVFVPMTEERSS